MGELRRLGDVLGPALARLATSDQARAYCTWARAAGDQVASGARPRAFRRGVLTIECSSAVWANELTYLGPQILKRMAELAPDHPVKRLRFIIKPSPDECSPQPAPAADAGRRDKLASADLDEARSRARDVDDEKLRRTIEAALRRSSEQPSEAPRGSAL